MLRYKLADAKYGTVTFFFVVVCRYLVNDASKYVVSKRRRFIGVCKIIKNFTFVTSLIITDFAKTKRDVEV